MKFSVVLDSVKSYIVSSEQGMAFKEAIEHIIEYSSDSGYDLQEAYFYQVLDNKEEYLNGTFSISLS